MRRILLVLLGGMLLAASLQPLSAQDKQPGPPSPKIKVGDTAPGFTLTDQNGNQVSLKDFAGKKNVVLAFYVFAFTDG